MYNDYNLTFVQAHHSARAHQLGIEAEWASDEQKSSSGVQSSQKPNRTRQEKFQRNLHQLGSHFSVMARSR
ncbi:MAG: hypothetical protein AAF629_34330 [Chloroflexota bacterium]